MMIYSWALLHCWHVVWTEPEFIRRQSTGDLGRRKVFIVDYVKSEIQDADGNWMYLVSWKDRSSEYDTWEYAGKIPIEAMKAHRARTGERKPRDTDPFVRSASRRRSSNTRRESSARRNSSTPLAEERRTPRAEEIRASRAENRRAPRTEKSRVPRAGEIRTSRAEEIRISRAARCLRI